jgi:hypothetical protein
MVLDLKCFSVRIGDADRNYEWVSQRSSMSMKPSSQSIHGIWQTYISLDPSLGIDNRMALCRSGTLYEYV